MILLFSLIRKINKFKDDIKARAEELVLKTFPRKTIELHRLLEVCVLF